MKRMIETAIQAAEASGELALKIKEGLDRKEQRYKMIDDAELALKLAIRRLKDLQDYEQAFETV